MTRRIAIVGGGIVGAALALRLARAGAAVTVIDAGIAGASAASFGWINASFHHDAAHFRLRAEGMAAWRRLAATVPELPLRWSGALWWEEQGAGLDRMQETLTALGYAVGRIERDEIRARVSCLRRLPEAALVFPDEGVAETGTAGLLLRAAQAAGARLVSGVRVTGLAGDSRVTGVVTPHGTIPADLVVLAAGTGVPEILRTAGLDLPLLTRPGLVLRTPPVPARIAPVLVTPEGEIRQDRQGRIVMPTAAGHQGDPAETVGRPDTIADAAFARLAELLDPGCDDWGEVLLGWRPVPRDGLPAIGPMAEGLYVSVMHSGVTLAAIAAELAAEEIGAGERSPLLDPYAPSRLA